MGDERKGFFHDAIYVDIRGLGSSGARKVQKVVDDFAGAKCLLDDFLDDRLARVAVRHLLGEHLDIV